MEEPNLYHIVIAEDDLQVASLLQQQLNRYGYKVDIVRDFQHVDEHIKKIKPDCIFLDINLPYYDGFYWCKLIRRFTKVPIMFISSRDGDMDQVFALENGGDDYITKPFHADVVVAKLKAMLRRTYGKYTKSENIIDDFYQCGPMKFDARKAYLECGGKTSLLSKTEVELLRRLVEAKGEVVSRNELLETLWDETNFVDDNTLTVNVSRLRHKLENIGMIGAIVTVRGAGYQLAVPEFQTKSPENHDCGRFQ